MGNSGGGSDNQPPDTNSDGGLDPGGNIVLGGGSTNPDNDGGDDDGGTFGQPSPPSGRTPMMFGAYIASISTSIGWGGQGGTCQLTLVEDPENDINIDLPAVGTACYLKYYGFYFGGVFQRYTYKQSTSGRTYDVVLESPTKLLDGIQIIMDEWQGTIFGRYDRFNPYDAAVLTSQVRNMYNPFGQLENYQNVPPEENIAHFGNSNVNSAGFPSLSLLEQIQRLSQGDLTFGEKANFGESFYTIDLQELYDATNETAPHLRTKGPVQSLSGILGDITSSIQVDYFVQLTSDDVMPDYNGGGVLGNPIMKIRICDRREPPTPNAVFEFVENAKNSTPNTLMSADVGRELQDVATQKVVIGGPASRYFKAPTATMYTVWNRHANQTYQIGAPHGTYNLGSEIPINMSKAFSEAWAGFNPFVTSSLISGYYKATYFELRMALAGKEAWETFKAFQVMANQEPNSADWNDPSKSPWVGKIAASADFLATFVTDKRSAIELTNTSAASANSAFLENMNKVSDIIFQALQKVAQEFYNKVFLAPLPMEPGGITNNLRYIADEYQYEAAWDVVSTAFDETRPIFDVSFYDGDGRLKAAAFYPQNLNKTGVNQSIDFSELGSDYAPAAIPGFPSLLATTRGAPEGDLIWLNGKPHVICKMGATVRHFDQITTPTFGLTVLSAYFFPKQFPNGIPPEAYMRPGFQGLMFQIPPDVMAPLGFGIPQESSRYKWGPWYAWNTRNGKMEVVNDDSLKPETFGGFGPLDQAAFSLTFTGLSAMTSVESGTVQVAEFPNFNVGDRFAGSGPYVTNMDISISDSGATVTYKFNTWTPNFGKLAKYNVDRISKINKASLAFMQKERGKFTRAPFKKFDYGQQDFSNTPADFSDRFSEQDLQFIMGSISAEKKKRV
tara:strand:- start:1592 stop:4288 length:2697 start_codon:yes stop_codon:yes gene_type:complete